jgi:methyl-accepting chemotaxis protein
MSGLGSLTVRAKIILAFALTLCCTVGVGVFAVIRVAELTDAAVLVGANVVAIQQLSQVAEGSERLLSLNLALASVQTDAERIGLRQPIEQTNRSMVEGWGKYIQTGVDPGEEQRLADVVIAAQKGYAEALQRLAGLNTTGARQQADTSLVGGAVTAGGQVRQAVAGSIAFQDHQSSDAVAAAKSTGEAAERLIIIALGALAIVCMAIGWALVITISNPITAMTKAMRRLADQDLNVDIPAVGRRDEIGAMGSAVQVFKSNALQARTLEQEQVAAQAQRKTDDERIRREAEEAAAASAASLVVGSIGAGLERLAAGDLTYRLETALPEAYEKLRANLNTAMDQLQDVVGSIVTNTSGIRSGTDEITQASDDLSRRTEQQAASLEETAAALDQITATVRKTADSAKHARDVVSRTRGDAEQSGEVVRQAVVAMGGIEQSSEQISQIIGVIDEIAFQTNLLALNAGVEAARAGEAGRGFAVVASEVRALAQRSAEAAKEIKTLISASAKQVDAGVKLVGETGASLSRIVAQVVEIATVVSDIAASAQEQATGLHEVNTAINQMDQVTQQNAAMVEESTAASHALAQETANLVLLTERFQIGGAAAVQPTRRPAKLPQRANRAPALKVVGHGGTVAARKQSPETDQHGWKEF